MGLQKVRPNFLAPSEGASLLRVPPTQGQFHFESYLPNFEDIGLFIAPRESGGGREVWVTDGTIDGTYQLTDINPDGNALPDDGHIAGGHLFFSALDSEHGEELRIIRNFTDFTPYKPSYTVYTNDEMDPIYSGSDGSDPEHLTAFGNEVYFEAYNGTHQLWKSDGTSSGTVQVKEFNGNAFPGDFTALAIAFFTAETIANGRELWRTDGTEDGTYMVKDIYYGNSDSDPEYLTVIGNTYFRS